MEDDDDDVELSLARASFSVEQIQRRYICIRVHTPLVIMSVFVYMHPKVSGILPLTEHLFRTGVKTANFTQFTRQSLSFSPGSDDQF